MRCVIPILAALLALAGCRQETENPSPDAKTSASAASFAASKAASPAAAVSAQGAARQVSEQNDLYAFEYAYPAEAAAIPALKAWLEADLAKQRAKLVGIAGRGRAEARQGGFPFHTHSRSLDWQVVADLPGWLSLSALVDAYSGGAHPNHWFDGLLWDKRSGKRRQPVDLFVSKQALSSAIREPFCVEIDRQRAEKRGEKVVRSSDDMFSECIDPANYIVILGSSNGATFDRVGFLVPPYEAGPYAEGSYEVTLPVTAAVLGAVEPQFRSSFSAGQ